MTDSVTEGSPPGEGSALARRVRRLAPVLSLLIFVGAVGILTHALRGVRFHDVVDGFREVPGPRILASLLLGAASYVLLSGYDLLSLRHLGSALPLRRILPAAFVGFAFTNSAGNSLVTGTPIRYRLYASLGVEATTITRVVLLGYLTFWIGVVFFGGALLAFFAPPVPEALHFAFDTARPIGLGLLGVAAVYLVTVARGGVVVRVGGWSFPLPGLGFTLAQVVLSSAEWSLSTAALWVLLPPDAVALPGFMGICLSAVVLGLVSQVPAGLGVVETVVGLSLAGRVPLPTLLGALVVYRVTYYLAPLVVAAVSLAAHEARARRADMARVGRVVGDWASEATPLVFGMLTLIAGSVLLFSGAIPREGARLRWVGEIVPLPLLEASHFLGSVVGLALLVLSRGLQRRSGAAYAATLAALAGAAALSLLRGLHWDQAAVYAALLLLLLPARREFYRRAALLELRWTPGWSAVVGILLAAMTGLVLFAYREVEYSHELWWRFALAGEAPRSMRAGVAAAVAAVAFALARLLRGGAPGTRAVEPDDVETAWTVARGQGDVNGCLAALGDKRFLFNEARTAFVQYGVSGRVWVSMGDPIGPPEQRSEIAWRFRELVDRYDGIPAFYQVGKATLPLYLDLGLTAHNIGEMARVPMADFSLEGSARKDLRQVLRRLEERERCTFEVVPPDGVAELLPRLREVSDEWLTEKKGREKRFSLGCFRDDYLVRFPTAVVRRDGVILAFANLWTAGDRSEMSFDLMRHVAGVPNGTMEYLFTRLLVWGKEQGFGAVNLGMAPLSGLENRDFAPWWNRIGALIFQHGEAFYGFQGLRKFKNKFHPEWSPRYVACPGGLALPQVLAASVALISGGPADLVRSGPGPSRDAAAALETAPDVSRRS